MALDRAWKLVADHGILLSLVVGRGRPRVLSQVFDFVTNHLLVIIIGRGWSLLIDRMEARLVLLRDGSTWLRSLVNIQGRR